MDYDKCSLEVQHKIVALKENRSELRINNSKERKLKKVQVDGCLIDGSAIKCDWIIEYGYDSAQKEALFVELKGCRIDDAIAQLKSTLSLTA